MKLKTWVARQGGPIAAGRLLGVHPTTVRAWLKGRASPRPLVMRQIVRLSKGLVTYAEIVAETTRTPKVKG